MPDYRATVSPGSRPVTFRGQTFKAGDQYESDSACSMLAFAGAVRAANPGSPRRDGTPNFWRTMERLCPAAPPPTPVQAPPGTPVEQNPRQTGDSATLQAAPNTQAPPVQGETTQPPRREQAPAPGDEPTRPPPGEVEASVSEEQSQDQNDAGDPIDLFTGAFRIQETDLEIPNTILPLSLVRMYRSGVTAFGAFGWNWDHNYNVYLRELDDGSVALWRSLHEDVFQPAGAGYEPPPGVFERLERLPGGGQVYELATEGGNRMRFERPPGWVDGERIPLVRFEDRHGNALRFTYGVADELMEVRDDDDRFVRFEYDECGLLVEVSDQAGRRYVYEHDEATAELVAVTSPPTSDQPDGITRKYYYADPFSLPELRHNIVRVEDAQGRIYLENAYEEDPAAPGFARVTEQRFGDYVFQFRYTQLQWVPTDPVYVNVPSVQVEVMNPDFAVVTHTFNYRGDLLDRRFRLTKDGSFRVVAVQFEFDDQGNLWTTTRSDGSQEINVYDVGNPDPRMRGKLLRRELRAAVGFPAPSRIVWRGAYEPIYQLLVEERTESNEVTAYRYDFDLTPGAPANSGKLKEIQLPETTLPDGTVQQAITRFEHNAKGQFTAAVLADGSRQEMEYGTVGNEASRLIKRTVDAGGLNVVNRFEYDAFGFDSTMIDGNGNAVARVVNVLGLLESETQPAVNGVTASYTFHYDSDRKVVRVERPRGAYLEPSVPDDSIVDAFRRDALGHPVRWELSANTPERRVFEGWFDFRGYPVLTRNPDGSRIDRAYDERGLLIEDTVSGLDGARLTVRRAYDRNGEVTRVIQPSGSTTRYEYDGFGRLARAYLPNGTEMRFAWREEDVLASVESVGQDGHGNVRRLERITYGYDERTRPTTETVDAFVDDPATAVPLTTAYYYNAIDRIERIVDHRGGTRLITNDALGRVTAIVDPLGHEERYTYDANSNVLRVERDHREPNGSISMLATEYEYDARNRQTAVVEPDAARLMFEYDARDLLVARSDYLGRLKRVAYNSFGDRVEEEYETGGTPIVHRWKVDTMGRLTGYEDPTGETSTYTLDGLGRTLQTAYPNGFSAGRTYDAAGNVVVEQLGSGARFEYAYDGANRLARIENTAAPAPVSTVGDHVFTYDGVDRVTSALVGSDRVVRHYDSRGRIVREETRGVEIACEYDDLTGDRIITWPDGRVELHEHDLNGTLTRIEETSQGALGSGGATIAVLTPSGPGHFGEAEYQGGLRVEATYDDRKRLVDLSASAPGGMLQTVHYRYDTANTRRVEVFDGANAEARYYEYDANYRISKSSEGFGVAVLPASTQPDHDTAVAVASAASGGATRLEEFEYDAADDRLTQRRTGQPDRNYIYLPGHRIQADGAETFAFSADGVMQSAGQVSYEADALGRVTSVAAGGTTVVTLQYDALGRPSALDEAGQPIRTFNHLGEDVLQEADNGTAVRQSTVHPGIGLPIAYHVAGATHYTLFDGRLSLLGLVDTSGTLLESYRYEPFGVPTILDPAGAVRASSQFDVEPVFGGQRYLASCERYLATRRLMDPRHGLFLSPDPLGYEASPSLYVYAAQNPIDLADPEGEFPFLAILAIMAIGAALSGSLNAARQGIQIAEDPRKRREGFSWSELGISMGVGAVAAPILVVAPELAIPLAAYGVAGGVEQWRQGNRLTGTFDIVTSIAPFGSRTVRTTTFGRGTLIGQVRGLGPAAPLTTRAARFALVEKNLGNFVPTPFGRRIGLGMARDTPQANQGHVSVIVEREAGGFWFAEKNAQPAPGRPPGSRAKVADFNTAEEPPPIWTANRRIGPLPFEYESINVMRSSAARALEYGQRRVQTTPLEPFDANSANCSHFAGDVLAQGGFRGMGNGRAVGLYNDFTNFVAARNMTYSTPFWVRLPEQPTISKR
jgi:RHS repeat-associated protein